MTLTVGCSLLTGLVATSPDTLRGHAQRAEALGFDSIWFTDHIAIPRNVRSRYPYAAIQPHVRIAADELARPKALDLLPSGPTVRLSQMIS
jgi:alkanesulfonate monooxygenase SsuD/methylene tetrahydromethanopterin reductase-like flavin-dependent oxidoreductase (luciferase family)